jgi:hypothetical protein
MREAFGVLALVFRCLHARHALDNFRARWMERERRWGGGSSEILGASDWDMKLGLVGVARP